MLFKKIILIIQSSKSQSRQWRLRFGYFQTQKNLSQREILLSDFDTPIQTIHLQRIEKRVEIKLTQVTKLEKF